MPNPSRFSQAVRRGCWLILSLSVQLAPHCAEDNTPDSDPALKFKARELSADETKMARAWFKELGSDAYDIRERALAKIIGQGPTVLPVATEFVNDPDPEIAATSRGLRAKILVKYDGYLPSDPTLLAALERRTQRARFFPLRRCWMCVKNSASKLKLILHRSTQRSA